MNNLSAVRTGRHSHVATFGGLLGINFCSFWHQLGDCNMATLCEIFATRSQQSRQRGMNDVQALSQFLRTCNVLVHWQINVGSPCDAGWRVIANV